MEVGRQQGGGAVGLKVGDSKVEVGGQQGGGTARWRVGDSKVEEQQCGRAKFGSGRQQDGGNYRMGDSRVEGNKIGGTVRWGFPAGWGHSRMGVLPLLGYIP